MKKPDYKWAMAVYREDTYLGVLTKDNSPKAIKDTGIFNLTSVDDLGKVKLLAKKSSTVPYEEALGSLGEGLTLKVFKYHSF